MSDEIWPDPDLEQQMLADAELVEQRAPEGSAAADLACHVRTLLDRVRYLETECDERRQSLESLLHVGVMMANLCYNLSQDAHAEGGRLEARTREIMRDLYKQWDDLRRKT